MPADDGGAAHLEGAALAPVRLPSTLGGEVDLSAAPDGDSRLVAYVYPRTGVPGEPSPPGWHQIPGARGCTPQSCAFRDHVADLDALGAHVVGISAQPREEQAASPSASTSPTRCSPTRVCSLPRRWGCRPSKPAACACTGG